jgi:hypothetical protein
MAISLKIACLIAGFFCAVLAIGISGEGGDALGYLGAFISVFCFATYT